MKRAKKWISILLSFTMVLSFFTFAPLSAAAEELTDQLIQQESVDNANGEVLQENAVNESDESLREDAVNESDEAELLASDITSWSALQEAIDDARNRSTIVLTRDLTASGTDTQLVIPEGKRITIDLNHHTLNRGLSANAYKEDGSVFYVEGSLTLKNSGYGYAFITGGSAERGGAIYNSCGTVTIADSITIRKNYAKDGGAIYSYLGTLAINGSTIQGNQTSGRGGAVFAYSATVTMTGGTITGNTASGDGGGICNMDGTLTVTDGLIISNSAGEYGGGICNRGSMNIENNATVQNNSAKYGGGICSRSNPWDYQSRISGGKVISNSATEGGGVFVGGATGKAGLDILGGEISENQAYNGGGIFISSNGAVTINGPVISGNYTLSRNSNEGYGGGIFSRGTLDIADVTITKNSAMVSGGAISVTDGTTTITDGNITSNSAGRHGGAVFLSEKGTLDLKGGTITENSAEGNGGGIYANTVGGAVFNIQDSPVVQNNSDAKKTSNVYLPNGCFITVADVLVDAQIGVTLEKTKGVFTTNYTFFKDEDEKKYVENPVSPARYFTSDDELSVSLDYTQGDFGEAVIQEAVGKNLELVTPFVPEEDQIETEAWKLDGWNWMSGISGERYLNEINVPCTHDSGCRRVDGTGTINEAFDYYAKTQYLYIDEQLDVGIRKLDLRLNNWHPIGTKNSGLTVKWRNDGENLWICHGKTAGGISFAQNREGEDLSLKEILGWVKNFLVQNPSETVLLEFSPELNTTIAGHNKSSDEKRVYDRLYNELYSLSKEINPSTGESFLYVEEGADNCFVPYTRYPKLKECRGQILIMTEDDRMRGLHFGDVGPVEGESENKCDGRKKIELVKSFYEKHNTPLLTNVNDHFDFIYSVGTTTSGPNSNYITTRHSPVEISEEIHKELFGPGNLFDEDGRYFGWVRLDGANKATAKDIWDSNFFDGLEACTITVNPGIASPNNVSRTYKVLKGTQIIIPHCIYAYDADAQGADFSGWKGVTASGTEDYRSGQAITVTEDMTFTGQWSFNSAPLRIVWKDGDNRDHLRKDDLVVILYTYRGNEADSYYIILKEDEGWSTVVPDLVAGVLPLSWGQGTIQSYNGTTGGRDAYMQYRYETTGNQREGYTITLTHTPNKKASVTGTVAWGDNVDEEEQRPTRVTLHLFKNGTEISSREASAESGWSYDFGEFPLYENGEKIEYVLTEDTLSRYTTVINGFSVTNILSSTMDAMNCDGSVKWADEENAANTRPECVTVHLLADGKEIASQEVRESEEGFWNWGFDDLPEFNDAGNKIAYSVTQDSVTGYRTEVLEEEGYEILNILETSSLIHTVTFDSSGADEVSPQKVVHGGLAQKPEDPAPPIDYFAFAGWYPVENGEMLQDEFDFSTPITEDILLRAWFVDDRGGAENFRVETVYGAPIIDEDNSDEVVESILTQKEITDNYGLVLISWPYDEEDVPGPDKGALAVKAVSLGVTSAAWFDISLYKMKGIWIAESPQQKLQEETTEKLTTVSAPLKLMAEVPESLQKNGRTYYLLSCHDGEAAVVAQGKETTFSWETDKFSTYLIAYKDAASHSGGSSGSSGSAATKYKVTLPGDLSNGSVESSLEKAKSGEQVTITVKPDEGYQVSAVNVTDKNDKAVEVTDNHDGTYTFTMPASAVTVTPSFKKIEEPDVPDDTACPKDDTCPITPFTDTDKNEWYHDGVHWALEKAVMNGMSKTTFEPLTATSRAMIVTMLWRMEGSPKVNGNVTFKDVSDGQWYTDAIRWAASNGIVTGYDEDTFGTNDSVTREQLAAILYRSAKAKGQGFTGTWYFPLNFDDADQVSEWADEAMHWMVMNGIIQGMSEKELSPQGDAVRAQVATMLMRFSQQLQA